MHVFFIWAISQFLLCFNFKQNQSLGAKNTGGNHDINTESFQKKRGWTIEIPIEYYQKWQMFKSIHAYGSVRLNQATPYKSQEKFEKMPTPGSHNSVLLIEGHPLLYDIVW